MRSMEIDYNESHWKKTCPKVDCHKKDGRCCGLKYVEIPSVLASEMTPKNGAFSNAIVKFEDTGEVWIYSAEGVPVKIKEGDN